MKLIIIRGASGTGKSTIAEYLRVEKDAVRVEADFYFGIGDTYEFDPKALGKAHGWCQKTTARFMLQKLPTIVVSNTSMTKWELNPYLQLAKQYDYDVEVYRTPGPWDADTLFARNVHGVPLATLQKQIKKYQPLDDETEWLVFFNLFL